MALSPADIDSFIAALHDDAALRDRVRGALLSDEFLALPESLRELDERMTKAHAEHVARMDALDERIRELDARLTARLDALSERLDRLTERIDAMAANMDARLNRIEGRLGNVEGWQYEARYRDNVAAHLARRIRKARWIVPAELDSFEDAYDRGSISEQEWDDVLRIDVLATGTERKGAAQIILAIELSMTVDVSDVRRARRRADILRRAGVDAEPAVDGDHILRDARTLAQELGVTVLVREPATTDAA